MMVVAHVGGVPVEEMLPMLSAVGTALALTVTWVVARVRRPRGRPPWASTRCRHRRAGLTEAALARARAGDGDAFSELVAPYRRELQVHCYRIVGSLQDAEDLLQETLLAAWRGLDRFEERASLRVWLYRIATNRCLNALRARGRRPKEHPAMVEPPEPTRLNEPLWLEPYPDVAARGHR